MLTATVTLLQGTIRAASADDRALAGDDDHGDWPPSPARLVAALVAADGTRNRCRLTTGAELALFERAGPPRIHASPRSRVLESALRERYVVANGREGTAVQEYPARTAQLVRQGTRLNPLDPRIAYVWEDVSATQDELRALEVRAARVGYLGCADSPVRVRISAGFDPASAPSDVWTPEGAADCAIPVPFPGFINVLDSAFDQWTSGLPVRRSWFATRRARYRSPDHLLESEPRAWPTAVWLRFDRSLSGRAALRTAETLKAAVLDRYQRDVAGSTGQVPPVLHGHGFDGEKGYQVAQWATLPDVAHPHARGRLHGAAIMLPAGTDPRVAAGLKQVFRRPLKLAIPGVGPVVARPHAGEQRPWAAVPARWTKASRRWVTVMPVVHERRKRPGPDLEEIGLWCEHAGFPRPIAAHLSRLPMIEGGLALDRTEVFRSSRPELARPYSHMELLFEREIEGPVVIGRARQFGMGLMAPRSGLRD